MQRKTPDQQHIEDMQQQGKQAEREIPELRDLDSNRVHLWEMLRAASSILELTNGMRGLDFVQDETIRTQVLQQFEVLGEEARRMNPQFARRHPQIPRDRLMEVRDDLVDTDTEPNYERLWEMIDMELGPLVEYLKPLATPQPQDPTAQHPGEDLYEHPPVKDTTHTDIEQQ